MNDQQIDQYLNWLSTEISEKYHVDREESERLVKDSPMREVIKAEPEYAMHMPLSHWAELVYENK